MKKRIALALLIALVMLLPLALAEQAQDITGGARFSAVSGQKKLSRLTDRDYNSFWQGSSGKASLTIESDTPIHGLYICWRQPPKAFHIEEKVNNSWQKVLSLEASDIVHQYYPLSGQTALRIVPEKDKGKQSAISELYVLGEGDVPGWVQQWQPTVADADLMLLFAHPDDEVLFFGGTLPTYVGEKQKQVLAVCLTDAGEWRRHELLNSLWTAGVKSYPIIGPFKDRYAKDLQDAYRKVATLRQSNNFVTGLIRQYRPEVIVTHDVRGEYGHGVHMLCAERARKGVVNAMDPKIAPKSYEQYGPFQVQKLYLHLYKENPIEMDWDQPLSAFESGTGYEVAVEAYGQHLSQHRYEQFKVEPRDSRYSSYRFGLAFTAVGEDIQKNDFFENIK